MPGERWPPVYDWTGLVKQITEVATRPNLAEHFYLWREDRSTVSVSEATAGSQVCQGDIVELSSDFPFIAADGQPAIEPSPTGFWMVIGNTCDFHHGSTDWTTLVPIEDLGGEELDVTKKDALRRYTQSRVFYAPPWSDAVIGRFPAADFLRPVTVAKGAFEKEAKIRARLSLPAWVLLNACLVRLSARDDGRFD